MFHAHNSSERLTVRELKSCWFRKFGAVHPHPDRSLLAPMNQFSNRFMRSNESHEGQGSTTDMAFRRRTLSLPRPQHAFSSRVKVFAELSAVAQHGAGDVMRLFGA